MPRGAVGIVVLMMALSGCRHRRVPVARERVPAPTYARTSGFGHRTVTVSYAPAAASHHTVEAWLLRDRPLDAVALMMSEVINLRRPLAFTVQECADLAYWDPNAGTLVVCLAWGAGPEKAGNLGPQLPADRRERCAGEFVQARNGWDRLLTPYSRVVGGETFWAR